MSNINHNFKCMMCGMCCRNISRYKGKVYPVLKELLGEKIPELTIEAENGVCVYLTDDNKCSIYEQRPIVCNTEKMFKLLSEAWGIPKCELYEAQLLSCKINQKIVLTLKK